MKADFKFFDNGHLGTQDKELKELLDTLEKFKNYK
jgi:hypothetical protein